MELLQAAKLAPLGTAAVAALALLLAGVTLRVQTHLARKRATVDFFIKAEMDEKMLDAYNSYAKGVEALKSASSIPEFCKTKNYGAIRAYLNIPELMAIGIENGIFDERICYLFWGDFLSEVIEDTKPLLDHLQGIRRTSYERLVRLQERWGGPGYFWQAFRWRSLSERTVALLRERTRIQPG